MDADQRLDGIDQRLQQIEERLSRLENAPVTEAAIERESTVVSPESDASEVTGVVSPEPDASEVARVVSPEPDATEVTPLLALAGKSILILGGAFLLRAATESTALPRQIGVVLGLLYAMAWIVAAALAARAGRRSAAVFHAAVAAIVAYPIVWEATVHFHVLSAVTAALLLVGFSIALIVVARLGGKSSVAPAASPAVFFPDAGVAAGTTPPLQLPAWIAVAGATLDALLLAYATGELIPFALELTFVGVVALILSMSYVGWLLAIESDLFALVLILMTLFSRSPDSRSPVVVTLLVFAIAWMTVTSRASVQVAVASLIGIAGASALVLSPSAMTILWGFAAVVAAEIARHTSSRVFALQSAAWGVFAAIGGGLFSFAAVVIFGDDGTAVIPMPALIAAALCLVAFARLDFARLPMLAIAVCAAAAVAIHAATTTISGGANTHAIVRTIILAAVAVALASIGRMWKLPEASQLAVATLALTGVQVIAQELRAGTAAIMFIALAVYGGAMLAIARLRRVATTS